jgi:glycerol-3-phosphate acyltransferase PlsY
VVGVFVYCLASYLLGAIPFGVLLSRLLRHQDPRRLGSGNIGAANVFRSVDPTLGLLTLICDVAKGWAPVWAAIKASMPEWAICLVGFCALLGHLFPVYLRFHGGKGVSTAAGIFLALAPYATLGSLVAFIVGVMLTGYVSAGSIVAAFVLPCMVAFFVGLHPYLWLAIFCSVAVLLKHRENIERLRKGEEKSWRS